MCEGGHLISLLDNMPVQITGVFRNMTDADADTMRSSLMDLRNKVDEVAKHGLLQENITTNFCDALKTVTKNIDGMYAEIKNKHNDDQMAFDRNFAHMPILIKGTLSELTNEMSSDSSCLKTLTRSIHTQLMNIDNKSEVGALQKAVDNVTHKLDTLHQQLTRNQNSTRVKGATGENQLYDRLCDVLTSRDNYSIEMVAGLAHNCDMVIRRSGHSDVRLESKAHGEGTGEKVRQREVTRFQSDLINQNSHGLFVSIHSGIVGKGELEIEQLSCGKFAVYLSNNNYDTDIIVNMLTLLYKLDKICDVKDDGGHGSIKVTNDAMEQVRLHLQDAAKKAGDIKTHLKASISLVDSFMLDAIKKIELVLNGSDACVPKGPPTPPESVTGSKKPSVSKIRVNASLNSCKMSVK